MKKILFIGPLPPPYAGPEIATKLFLDSDLQKRFDIIHLNTTVRKSNAQKGKIDLTGLVGLIKFLVRLIYLQIRHRPEIVYYPITATLIGWIRDSACIIISTLLSNKIVIHLRAGHFRLFYEHSHPKIKKWIKFLLNRCTLVIVQSNKLRNQFQGLVRDEKIQVLYNAVSCNDFSNLSLLSKNRSTYKVLFLGHLSYAKGYCTVLKAIPIIVKEFRNIEFQFAGTKKIKETNIFYDQVTGQKLCFENPDEIYNKYIRANRLDSHVHYLGNVYGNDKMQLFANADIFILPSYSEGFSLSVLEALASGLVVVTTPVGALGEIIEDGNNGFTIKPGDVMALAENIIYLLQNDYKRKAMGYYNKQFARNHFDISIIAQQLGDFFDKI